MEKIVAASVEQAHAANTAMTSLFQAERPSRGVADGHRSASKASWRFVREVVILNTVQSPEDFMRKFLEELLAFEKQEESRRLLFHERFYADDCHWGKDPGKLWRARSLKVLSVSSTATKAEVIASRLANNEPERYCQIRFRLSNYGQGWLISGVDLRCCCGGDGQPGEKVCPKCHGTGWKDTNPVLAQMLKDL